MDVFKISVPNGIEVGTFDNTTISGSLVKIDGQKESLVKKWNITNG